MTHDTLILLSHLARVTPAHELALLSDAMHQHNTGWSVRIEGVAGTLTGSHTSGLQVTVRCGVSFEGEDNRALIVRFADEDVRSIGMSCWGWDGAIRYISRRLDEYLTTDSKQVRTVVIDYTNHRGVRTLREIIPALLEFASTAYHPTPQWLLHAHDVKKGDKRIFALKDIHAWGAKVFDAEGS